MDALRPMVVAPSHMTTAIPPRAASTVLMNIHRNSDVKEVVGEFRRLQQQELFTDVVLSCGDGSSRRVHALVLAASSQFLKTWMDSHQTSSEHVIILPDVSGDDLDVLISILYGFDVRVSDEEVVTRLFDIADLLSISISLPLAKETSSSPPICCWHCNAAFKCLDELQSHLPIHIGERFKEKVHKCNTCQKTMPTMWRLRQHLAMCRKAASESPISARELLSTAREGPITEVTTTGDHMYAEKPTTATMQMPKSDHLYSAKRLTRKEAEARALRKEKSQQMKKMDHLYSAPSSPTGGRSPERPKPSTTKKKKATSIRALGHSYAAAVNSENSYACDHCDKAFPQPYRLNRHIREVHEKEKLHVCRICDKGFFKVTSLTRHEATHEAELDRWICGDCGKSFRDESCLKYHERKKVCKKPSRLIAARARRK